MIDARAVLVLIGYGWLLVELLRLPVPSEASVYQLMLETGDETDNHTPLAQARVQSPGRKLVVYFLPTALGVALFLIPVVAAFWRPLIDYLIPLHGLDTALAFWVGAGLLLGGRILTFVSVLQLRPHKVRAEPQYYGLFRWSRNPGLLGMYAFYLGLCFLFPCVVLFIGLIPYVWNMHSRVLLEESHLSSRLGAPYANYVKRVPRYLGF